MAYKIYLGIDEGEQGFILPIPPEKIEFSEEGDNKTYDIVNLGEISVLGIPKLTKVSFEGIFPKSKLYNIETKFSPKFYLSKISQWREEKKNIRFIYISDVLEVNDLFTIESFKFYEQGGEVGDVYYSIELKKFKPYISKKLILKPNSNKIALKNSSSKRSVEMKKPKIHTVVKGDYLWKIAKKYLGDGSRYKEIAHLNNIRDSDTILPGQKLKLP